MPLGGFAPLPLRLGGSAEEGITAAQFMRATADLAAVRRVLPFAVMIINPNSLVDPYLEWYQGQNGNGVDDEPTVSYGATSVGNRIIVTFRNYYTDPAGVRTRLKLRGGRAAGINTNNRFAVELPPLPNVVWVHTIDAGASFLLRVF